MRELVLSILLLIIANSFSFSQKLEPKERPIVPDHVISSEITDRDYQIYISFPSNYDVNDSLAYPVLYVLDGQRNFDFFYRPNFFLGEVDKIEQVIIVGIDAGIDRRSQIVNRTFHFTPTANTDTANVRRNEMRLGLEEGSLKSGGADDFLKVIKTEIAPFIDKNYKTNDDRGITGHSLGGLFVSYALINSDGYFTRFGINSPSLWWNDEAFLNQAIHMFKNESTWEIPHSKVFISTGGNESIYILPTTTKFYTHLRRARYNNIILTWKIFENESHKSVRPLSLRQTILELYGID